MMVRPKYKRVERTEWRDEAFSKWHGEFLGYNSPACDIDFLLLEYDHAKAKALIEHKQQNANLNMWWNRPNCNAITDLADKASIPAFTVVYSEFKPGSDPTWLEVFPMNRLASDLVEPRSVMSPEEYREFMYRIRGRRSPF